MNQTTTALLEDRWRALWTASLRNASESSLRKPIFRLAATGQPQNQRVSEPNSPVLRPQSSTGGPTVRRRIAIAAVAVTGFSKVTGCANICPLNR